MTAPKYFSYPTTSFQLEKAMDHLGFEGGEALFSLDLLPNCLSKPIFHEHLWSDKRFYSICEILTHGNISRMALSVTSPSYKYFSELYGCLPVLFGHDAKSSESYRHLCSKRIGKTNADAIPYLWKKCAVIDSKMDFFFSFDREKELGIIYYKEEIDLPNSLLEFT
jgi:hypothetical protein